MENSLPREASRTVSVIVERRPSDHPWIDWSWRPVGVLDGSAKAAPWTLLAEEDGVKRFHAGSADLRIHRKEVEAYRINLADRPVLYVVLRESEEGDHPFRLHEVTVSPYEAQDELDGADAIVEPVAMPPAIAAWLAAFCDAQPEPEPFVKRRRARTNLEKEQFSKEPIFARSARRPSGEHNE